MHIFGCGDGKCDTDTENCLSCPIDCADGISAVDESLHALLTVTIAGLKQIFSLRVASLDNKTLECGLPSVNAASSTHSDKY